MIIQSIVEVAKARALTSQILELASASRTSLRSYKVAVDHLAAAEAHAGSQSDIMGVYGAVRVESGLPFGNADSPDEYAPNNKLSRGLVRIGLHHLVPHAKDRSALKIYAIALSIALCSIIFLSLASASFIHVESLRTKSI